ncbi:apoptosis-associated speck-like protein containing a CARD isoform X1 [Thalassophryne amazonica]|uniref:apoptosis-associated speck-like protein containing a CARD isoform X1 n=1 Tax=Thalassophryne amazonica TaxID=390379 RepID=UPI0014710E71|nr:apoptosis-associated speck-like protein containing a CARD isoform X1 [Thalassophryne amazonica]
MSGKTIKKMILDTLEDLSQDQFAKFCHQLLDRREEPRVKRNKVEGKKCLEVTDVLVSTFTERGAVPVVLGLLRDIDCNEAAETLDRETCGQSMASASASGASAGGSGLGAAEASTGKHFVDEHEAELIQRVRNIGPILDQLLAKGVVNREMYDTIMGLPTSQAKMRAVYNGPLQGGQKCKDIFYKLLLQNESFLVDDLKK